MQPVQLKMARAALDLSVDQLARAAGLSSADITRVERGESGGEEFSGRLRAVFEEHGVVFVGADMVQARLRNGTQSVPVEDLTTANDK